MASLTSKQLVDLMKNEDPKEGFDVTEALKFFFSTDGGGDGVLKHTIVLQADGWRVEEAADAILVSMRKLKEGGDIFTNGPVLKILFKATQYRIVGLAKWRASPEYKAKMNLEEAKRIVEAASK